MKHVEIKFEDYKFSVPTEKGLAKAREENIAKIAISAFFIIYRPVSRIFPST